MYLNCTTDNTNSCPRQVSTTRVVLTSIFVFVVMFATILGNSLVIFSVYYYHRLRGRTNYFIVSLAVADWLIGMLSNPFRLRQTLNYEKWPEDLNESGCRFWIWIDMLCCAASILSLMAISIDRLIAILDPLKYEERMRPWRVYLMICITWVFALICACLSLVPWKKQKVIKSSPQCSIQSKEYVAFVSTTAFFVPLVVVIVNYGLIFRVAIGHAKRLENEHISLAANYQSDERRDANHNEGDASTPSTTGRTSFLKLPTLNFARRNSKKSNKHVKLSLVKQLKATKTLAIVIGVFCVCWLPFFIIFVTFQYCPSCFKPPHISRDSTDVLTTIFVVILPVANSAANPIIYTCFNVEFRKAFKRILWKVLKIKAPLDSTATTFTAVPSAVRDFSGGSRETIERL